MPPYPEQPDALRKFLQRNAVKNPTALGLPCGMRVWDACAEARRMPPPQSLSPLPSPRVGIISVLYIP